MGGFSGGGCKICGIGGIGDAVCDCLADIFSEPIEVVITNPTPDVEKITYCNTDTDTWWQKVCIYTFDADGVPTENIMSNDDTGIPCVEPPPADPEVYTTEQCIDGTIFVQLYQVVFENGTAQPPIAIGDPVDTGKPCDELFQVVETCVQVDVTANVNNGTSADCDHGNGEWVIGDEYCYLLQPTTDVGVIDIPLPSWANSITETNGVWEICYTLTDLNDTPLPIEINVVENGHLIGTVDATTCAGGNDEVVINATIPQCQLVCIGADKIIRSLDGTIIPLDALCQSHECEGDYFDTPPCNAIPQCYKDKFIEGGLDNTFTNFTHTNQVFTVAFSDGTSGVFNVASATDFSDQVTQMAAGLDGLMPWAQTVDPFCTNGCGGLPAPFVDVPGMVLRYVGFRVCPGDVTPESVKYTSDQREKPVELVINYVETDTIYLDRCKGCENCAGNGVYTIRDTGEPYTPVCAIPCVEEFPPVPLTSCETELVEGFCDLVSYGEPDIDDEIVATDIFIAVITCDGVQSIEYLQLVDGALEPYTVVGQLVDCDTLEPFEPPPPPCPEGAVFECVEYTTSYFILDNSNWIGAPTPHITNGFNFELTFTKADGSTAVWQQSADPLFNNFVSTAPDALGCKVLPVCANHTSPKGCNASHAANLAMYPAYDAPTFPADIQNNLTNPDQAELWASGWLLDCAGCDSPVVRVEITAANDAAYVGAYKEPTVYESDPITAFRSVNCDGVFWTDCDGSAIVEPISACCAKPCTVATTSPLDAALTECCDGGEPITYTNANENTELTVSVGNGDIKIQSGQGDGSDQEITDYITACLAAGNDVDVTFETDTGETGSVTLLHVAQTNPFPDFYNESENATTTAENGVGKLSSMTATCLGGECKPAIRVVGDENCPIPVKPSVIPGAPIDVCIEVEQSCITLESHGGGQASDWNDPLGEFEFYMNEEFGGQDITVATSASMATMTTAELERLFIEGTLLSAGCNVTAHDTVYTQIPDGDGYSYEFSITLCPYGEDECLKQTGWRGFIDLQTNSDPKIITVTESATLQNFCDADGNIVKTTLTDCLGNPVEGEYTIVKCPVEVEAPHPLECAIVDCPDPCTNGSTYIYGRPPAGQPWEWGPYSGANLNEFEAALEAAGYTVTASPPGPNNEKHQICPPFGAFGEDPDAPVVNSVGSSQATVEPNINPDFVAVDTCAVQTIIKEPVQTALDALIVECCAGGTETTGGPGEIGIGVDGSTIKFGFPDGNEPIPAAVLDCIEQNGEVTLDFVNNDGSTSTWTGTTVDFQDSNQFVLSGGTNTDSAGLNAVYETVTIKCGSGDCNEALNSKICNVDELAQAIADAIPTQPNTHVIEGCVLVDGATVDGFTIVNDAGEPLFAPKPLSELGFVDCCTGEGGTGGGNVGEPNDGTLVSDNFQDGNGNAPFNLQVRNTTGNPTDWCAVIENVPYATIPNLNAGAYTLTTTNNGNGTYTHTFCGTSQLGGFQNITITGGTPSPAGNGSAGSNPVLYI